MIKYFLPEGVPDLVRATEGSSGYDVRANIGVEREIEKGQRWKIATGLHLEMPLGVEAQVRSRSGLAMNHGVEVMGAPCTIDADYRGEVMIMLINHGNESYVIKPGDRIAQLVFAIVLPMRYVDTIWHSVAEPIRISDKNLLSSTSRDKGGFGHTGR